MTWLGAAWLWCLPLVAAPVVFHLAFRRRRARLDMPSLLFFKRLAPRLAARKRLRDWLVLALRCLVIALAILALARPNAFDFGGGGAASLVLVVDNSASMAMPSVVAAGSDDAPSTRLALALDGAAALVGALESGDRAAVLTTVADAAVPDLGMSGDATRLRAVLDQVRETEAAASPAAALMRAAQILEATGSARREVHLFTDAQESDWGVAGEMPTLPAGTLVVVHRIAAGDAGPDAALAELRLSPHARLANRPIPLRATLTNPGGAEAAVTITVQDDGGRRVERAATVPPRGRVDVPLAVPAAPAGERWVQVVLSGDGFAGDDRGFVAFTTSAARMMVFIGERRDHGALPLAIAPDADGNLSGIAARMLPDVAAALAAAPAAIAIPWDRCAGLDVAAQAALRTFVDGGGRLLIAPRPAGDDAVAALPAWCGVRGAEASRFAKGESLVALAADADCWRDLVAGDGTVALGRSRAGRALALDLSDDARGVLGLGDGRPVLSERALGRGRVFVAGIAWSPLWTTLPLSPSFLALAQAMALPPAADDEVLPLVAGSPIVPRPSGEVAARARAGAVLDWRGVDQSPPLARAGVYELRADEGLRLAVVRAAPLEGAPGQVAGATIPALGAGVHRVVDHRGADAMLADWWTTRTGFDAAPWLIGLALIALALETWLADRPLVPPQVHKVVLTDYGMLLGGRAHARAKKKADAKAKAKAKARAAADASAA
ncbi:MAG TPA: BatA domain-containing protein [Planctomycetota bacterium]|nr:BatA domain-containing protein [Planctomycetota bacterium]